MIIGYRIQGLRGGYQSLARCGNNASLFGCVLPIIWNGLAMDKNHIVDEVCTAPIGLHSCWTDAVISWICTHSASRSPNFHDTRTAFDSDHSICSTNSHLRVLVFVGEFLSDDFCDCPLGITVLSQPPFPLSAYIPIDVVSVVVFFRSCIISVLPVRKAVLPRTSPHCLRWCCVVCSLYVLLWKRFISLSSWHNWMAAFLWWLLYHDVAHRMGFSLNFGVLQKCTSVSHVSLYIMGQGVFLAIKYG